MLSHPLTNFEIQKYYQNELKGCVRYIFASLLCLPKREYL